MAWVWDRERATKSSLVSERIHSEVPCTDRVPKASAKKCHFTLNWNKCNFGPPAPPPHPRNENLEVWSQVGLQNSKCHFTPLPLPPPSPAKFCPKVTFMAWVWDRERATKNSLVSERIHSEVSCTDRVPKVSAKKCHFTLNWNKCNFGPPAPPPHPQKWKFESF